MTASIFKFFSDAHFLPHGHCFLWQPNILWLHVISDGLIALAYFSIPIALLYFVRTRRDIKYRSIFILFGIFILGCGLTHLAAIYTIWIPNYALEGVIKAITAAASVLTAIVLWPTIPLAVKLPSYKQLDDKNKELSAMKASLESRIAERVRDSERLAAIVNSSQDAILSKSLDGTILTWNKGAEKILQFTSDEMVGRSIYAVVPIERHSEERSVLDQVAAGVTVAPFETIRLRKDGAEVHVSETISPIRNLSGQVVGCSSVVRDLAEVRLIDAQLKKTTEELRESNRQLVNMNKAKDEFISNLSHELRTPLNIILGYSDIIDKFPAGSQEHQTAIEVIKRNAKVQLHLVEDLLDMSRILTGKFSLSVNTHSVEDIVDNAIKAVEFAARSKDIAILKDIATDEKTVVCDAVRLQQILWNLLSNAVKWTNQKGQVTIRSSRSEGSFIFQVSDTGHGIDPRDLPHLFDRLWQAESPSGQKGGLGLGLKISKDLVEAHGGSIKASSAGLGKGATFTVQIPIRAVEPGRATDCSILPLTGLNVLVVDDSPDAVELIRIVLKNAGADVVTANNGAEALDLVSKNNIQFIISDINMPIMDGFLFMEQTRIIEEKKGAHKHRPAIALTARTGPGEKERAYKSGYQRHLIKPVQPKLLVENVLEVLRKSPGDLKAQ